MTCAPFWNGLLAGYPVRFWPAPRGRDEAPWLAMADLHTALQHPADDLPRIEEALRLMPEGSDQETVLADEGPILIVSATVVHAFLAGAVQSGRAEVRQAVEWGALLGEAIDHALDLARVPPQRRPERKREWLEAIRDPVPPASPDPDTSRH